MSDLDWQTWIICIFITILFLVNVIFFALVGGL